MKTAVASDAAATPKLIDICCSVLAIVLAMRASRASTSAYTSVFMLVYWNDAAVGPSQRSSGEVIGCAWTLRG